MSIPHLIRQIRALPYNDMMMVAQELRDRIGELTHHKIEAAVLADILVHLQAGTITPSDATLQEEKVLREIFSRKRQITVSRKGNGWEINIPTLPGAQVLGTELRPMFPMQLDQIITMHVLSNKQPFEFSPDEPFAFCNCGTTEWGNPRPAEYVRPPLAPSLEDKLGVMLWYLEEVRSGRRQADPKGFESFLDDPEVAGWLDKMNKAGRIRNTRFTHKTHKRVW